MYWDTYRACLLVVLMLYCHSSIVSTVTTELCTLYHYFGAADLAALVKERAAERAGTRRSYSTSSAL
jgi:hypothetical protein